MLQWSDRKVVNMLSTAHTGTGIVWVRYVKCNCAKKYTASYVDHWLLSMLFLLN